MSCQEVVKGVVASVELHLHLCADGWSQQFDSEGDDTGHSSMATRQTVTRLLSKQACPALPTPQHKQSILPDCCCSPKPSLLKQHSHAPTIQSWLIQALTLLHQPVHPDTHTHTNTYKTQPHTPIHTKPHG